MDKITSIDVKSAAIRKGVKLTNYRGIRIIITLHPKINGEGYYFKESQKLWRLTMDKYFLNLAGEYRVCSEILKLGLFATVTYGNKKSADIYVVGPNKKIAVIEVKTTESNRFVTNFYQKFNQRGGEHPDFWVLCKITNNIDRFFVLSHDEMEKVQLKRNFPGQELNWEEASSQCLKGVDNVLIDHINGNEFEKRWDKIQLFINGIKE